MPLYWGKGEVCPSQAVLPEIKGALNLKVNGWDLLKPHSLVVGATSFFCGNQKFCAAMFKAQLSAVNW
jgi:hypothetical protein